MARTREGKGSNFPVGKVVFTGIAATGLIAILYKVGVFTVKPKKVRCRPGQLSTLTMPDGTTGEFSPDTFAISLYDKLGGYNWTTGAGTPYYQIIGELLSENDIKCLHNAWLKFVDENESLYKFIKAQLPVAGSTEYIMKHKALKEIAKAKLATK